MREKKAGEFDFAGGKRAIKIETEGAFKMVPTVDLIGEERGAGGIDKKIGFFPADAAKVENEPSLDEVETDSLVESGEGLAKETEMLGNIDLLGGAVEFFQEGGGKFEAPEVGEDVTVEIKHFGAGEGGEATMAEMDDYVGDTKKFDAAGEARFFFADAVGEGGNFALGSEKTKNAVGFAEIGATKDDGVSAEVGGHDETRG